MVRIHPDPPTDSRGPPREAKKQNDGGAIAQLGERLLCKQEVIGSIPIGSTSTHAKDHQSAPRATLIVASSRSIDRLLFNNLERR